MAVRKRPFSTFSLSFLDVMSCGFGAIVLVFLIIDHAGGAKTDQANALLVSELRLLEQDVAEGEKNRVRVRNTLSMIDLQVVEAQGMASRISAQIAELESSMQQLLSDNDSDAAQMQRLRADIARLQQQIAEMNQAQAEQSGSSVRSYIGDGDRQYLTGLKLGGEQVLILLDCSASMLAEDLVNVLRLRNMSDAIRRKAEKWTRSLATVEWLVAQLPVYSRYQLYCFNTQSWAVLPGSQGQWLDVADSAKLEQLVQSMHQLVPSGGTSLESAILAILDLSPLPDNVFLITDGLPTQGAAKPRSATVSGKQRLRLFEQALAQVPRGVTFNVILAPMEGDPMAASAFWQLAQLTQGAFISPSRDWP